MSIEKKTRNQIFLVIGLIPLLALAIWCEISLHKHAAKREAIKYDFSTVNNITYGLLSVNAWKDDLKEIITHQIDTFQLTEKQDSVLQKVAENALDKLITQAENMLEQSDTTFIKKIRNFAINAFVDVEALRKQVPKFADAIIDELTNPKNKERLKNIAKEKFEKFAAKTYDDKDSTKYEKILKKYDVKNKSEFNAKANKLTAALQKKTYRLTYVVLGVLGAFLLFWVLVYRRPQFRKTLFIMSVLLALSVLITGITTPMIEIDARIKKVDFTLLGQHIEFHNQMLFYQSKSIIEVVKILLKTKTADSVIVGILILAFSVLLPISKLIATEIYLIKENWRSNRFLHWLAMKSGKWSMADVMVVAISMTYVGLKGIVNNQLGSLQVDTESLTSITTNLTSLLPGYILFLSFVLFGLILAEILNRITP